MWLILFTLIVPIDTFLVILPIAVHGNHLHHPMEQLVQPACTLFLGKKSEIKLFLCVYL